MIAAFILTLDTGESTDLLGIAEDVKDIVDGQAGLLVVECKPYPHPTLYPPPPVGAPESQTPPTG